MKEGYKIYKIEHCKNPGAVEVRNLSAINEVAVVFWHNYSDCMKDKNSIGVFKVKYKNT